MRIGTIEDAQAPGRKQGERAGSRLRAAWGGLHADDVAVELYLGRLNAASEIVNATAVPMQAVDTNSQGEHVFAVEASCRRSGLHGYTIRIRSKHPDLGVGLLPGLIYWAAAFG